MADTGTFMQEFVMWILGIMGTVITTILIPYLAAVLNARLKNDKWEYVINELEQTVSTSVSCIQQKMVDQMKKDGIFNAENQQKALQEALSLSLDSLTDTAKKILGKEGIDVESLIMKYIEAKVSENKKTI